MTSIRRFAGVASFVLLLLLHQTTLTQGSCACQGPTTIQSSFAGSQAAVFAYILEKLTPPTDPASPQYYRANADGVAKGCGLIYGTEFYIKTSASERLCGVTFLQPKELYILFGTITNEQIVGFPRGNQPVLTIDLCQAHTLLSDVPQATQGWLYNQPIPVCNQPAPVPVPAPVSGPRSAPIPVPGPAPRANPVPAPRPSPPAPVPAPTNLINCRTCPTGYYDGCNTCTCDWSYRATCTEIACPQYTRPYCRWAPAPSPRAGPVPPVPVPRPVPVPAPRPNPVPVPSPRPAWNCRTCPNGYYDGCNTCTCDRFGIARCTEIACRTYGQPYCRIPWPPVPRPVPVPAPRPNPVPAPRPSPTLPVVVNCQTCPTGYYDGCNTCSCDRFGRALCTTVFCVRLDTPSCRNVIRPPPSPIINCSTCQTGSYYDGCNTCTCLSGRPGAVCTERVCSTYGTPRCGNIVRPVNPPPTTPISYPAPSPRAATTILDCRTCPNGYYDGCNSCGCSGNGDETFCTLRFCPIESRETPRCNPPPAPTPKTSTTTTIDCRTCPKGYFDGCNYCSCGSDGTVSACTKMLCPEDYTSTPKCN